jgi:hypothetical protein
MIDHSMIEINSYPAFNQAYDSDGRPHWFCERCAHLVDDERVDNLMLQAKAEEIRSKIRLTITVITATIVGSIVIECIAPLEDTWLGLIIFILRWLLGCAFFGMIAAVPANFVYDALERRVLHMWARSIRPRPSGG